MTQYGFRMKLSDDTLGAVRRAIIHYCEEGRRRERADSSYCASYSGTLRRFRAHMSQQHKWQLGCTIWDHDLFALEAAFASYVDFCSSKIADGEIVPFKCDKRLLEGAREEMWDKMKRAVLDRERPNK